MIAQQQLRLLRARDAKLIEELATSSRLAAKPLPWRNRWLKAHKQAVHTLRGLTEVERALKVHGTLTIRTERHHWVDSDGERRVHTLARAATTDMWPMGTSYWVRDNSIIGARYLSSDSKQIQKLGKDVLLSALSFMSSVAQAKRFESIIRSASSSYRKNASNWPYIFASIKDNLTGQKAEPWSHKQDAWQMTAWYVLRHIMEGRLSLRDLTAKHRQFFGYIIPFLAKVEFWRSENSGSWEEIPAVRTSVRAWEHRLIVLLGELAGDKKFTFLEEGFKKQRRYLGRSFAKLSLQEAVRAMDSKATKAMLADVPFESPGYKKKDIRYREADAALIYLLELDYPAFLLSRVGAAEAWVDALEMAIVRLVEGLQDKRTGGISRYANDSYQRSGFFRYEMVEKLNAIYGAPSGDASDHFAERERAIPQGRNAAWTHFVWQLSGWAGKRYLVTGKSRYKKMHDVYFLTGLRLVTGEGEASIETVGQEQQVYSVPAWRMPEAYISDKDSKGRDLVFPSPHTPLNWPIAEMAEVFRVRREIVKRLG